MRLVIPWLLLAVASMCFADETPIAKLAAAEKGIDLLKPEVIAKDTAGILGVKADPPIVPSFAVTRVTAVSQGDNTYGVYHLDVHGGDVRREFVVLVAPNQPPAIIYDTKPFMPECGGDDRHLSVGGESESLLKRKLLMITEIRETSACCGAATSRKESAIYLDPGAQYQPVMEYESFYEFRADDACPTGKAKPQVRRSVFYQNTSGVNKSEVPKGALVVGSLFITTYGQPKPKTSVAYIGNAEPKVRFTDAK